MEIPSGSPSPPPLPEDARTFFTELGHQVAGPMIAAMVGWMISRIRERKPDVLLFLGRDGRIIREVWQQMCPGDLAGLPTQYVLASRRALRMAALQRIDGDFHRLLTHHAEGLPLIELFQALHLPPQRIEAAVREHAAVSPRQPYHRSLAATAAQILHLLGPEIQERARIEEAGYQSYLNSLDIGPANRVGIVDIGWHGSLQAAIGDLLRQKSPGLKTDGFYLALFDGTSDWRRPEDRMEACLLQDGLPVERAAELSESVELLEFLFSSTEPGLLCFERTEAGEPLPVYMEDRRSGYQKDALLALGEGIVSCAREGRADLEGAYRKFRRIAFHPTPAEARYLGSLQARRGFGKAGLLQPFALPGNPVLNLLHWARLYRNFKEALWRHGFWAALSRPERGLLRIISPIGTSRFIRSGRGH